MDIKKLQPEAEVTYQLESTGEPVSITFKVGFLELDAIPDYVNESREGTRTPRLSAVIRKAIADTIHGWDLTEGGQPLPCTRDNKDKYLPLLFGLKVKRPVAEVEDESNPIASILVMVLAQFAGTAENFLKN
jgi:hypothetical protein